MTHFTAADPSFAAYVTETDPTSVRDLLLERQRELDCDLMMVLDARGMVRARTDRPGTVSEDLSTDPLVAAALEHGEASGLMRDGERHWTAAIVDRRRQESLLGFLIAPGGRRESGPRGGRQWRRRRHLALAQEPKVVASTLGTRTDPGRREARQDGVPRRPSGAFSVGGCTLGPGSRRWKPAIAHGDGR
jgi:hypothetical protein